MTSQTQVQVLSQNNMKYFPSVCLKIFFSVPGHTAGQEQRERRRLALGQCIVQLQGIHLGSEGDDALNLRQCLK